MSGTGALDRAVELDLFGWPRTPPPPVPWGEVALFAAALLVLVEWTWLLSRWS